MSVEQTYRRKLIRMRMRQEAAMRSAFIRVSKEFTQKFGNSPIVRQQEGFLFKSHPKLNKDLTEMMGKFKTELYENVSGGMQSAWDLGNELNDDYVEHYFKGLKGFKSTKKFMMDRNTKAMNAFISRKHNTRTLSDRIWKTSNRFRDELEANLLIGIEDGKSASDIAKDTQKYLKRPDDLFRRVRDTEGKLRLSNAAKKFHPGRGVYRSSYKNALRVSRTEVNSAYRMSDHERWKKQDFILGFDINLSAQHPRPDMCDELAGRYPKDFIFPGWHPQCMCNVTPVRMNKKDFIDRLNGKVVNVKPVTNLPTNFTKWMSANKVRIAKMKNKPYFILDNKNLITAPKKIPIETLETKRKLLMKRASDEFDKNKSSDLYNKLNNERIKIDREIFRRKAEIVRKESTEFDKNIIDKFLKGEIKISKGGYYTNIDELHKKGLGDFADTVKDWTSGCSLYNKEEDAISGIWKRRKIFDYSVDKQQINETLHRGLTLENHKEFTAYEKYFKNNLGKSVKLDAGYKGSPIIDFHKFPGFSTSKSYGVANDYAHGFEEGYGVMFEFRKKATTKGLDLGEMLNVPEQEVILPYNRKYKVLNVKFQMEDFDTGEGVLKVILEQL